MRSCGATGRNTSVTLAFFEGSCDGIEAEMAAEEGDVSGEVDNVRSLGWVLPRSLGRSTLVTILHHAAPELGPC